jgi:hypothetical protein
MFARVARFEGVDAAKAESVYAEAEAIIRPMVEALPGFSGFLDLVAADGQYMSIAFFDSEENALAAEPTFDEEMPRKLGDLYSKDWTGRRVAVGRYRVVTDERR